MSIGRSTRDTETDPFYDMLFNMLIAFVFCFVIDQKARGFGEHRQTRRWAQTGEMD